MSSTGSVSATAKCLQIVDTSDLLGKASEGAIAKHDNKSNNINNSNNNNNNNYNNDDNNNNDNDNDTDDNYNHNYTNNNNNDNNNKNKNTVSTIDKLESLQKPIR